MKFQVVSKRNQKRRTAHFMWAINGTRAIQSSKKELMIKPKGTGFAPTGRGEPLPLQGSFYKLKNLSRRELIKAREWVAWV